MRWSILGESSQDDTEFQLAQKRNVLFSIGPAGKIVVLALVRTIDLCHSQRNSGIEQSARKCECLVRKQWQGREEMNSWIVYTLR